MSRLILPGRGIISPAAYGAAVASFSPSDLSNLAAWWDSSNSGSITESGGAVSQWNDLSGNARHATQSTGANQPTLTTFNSHAAIRFNPASSQYFNLSSFDLSASAFTAFVAMKTSGSTPVIGTTSGYYASLYYDGVSGVMYWTGQGTIPRTSSGVSQNGTTGNVVTTQVTDGTHALLRLDGTAQTSSQPGGSVAAWDAIGVGWSTTYANAYIFEIVVYSDAKNTTDMGSVEAYLKAKWGTP